MSSHEMIPSVELHVHLEGTMPQRLIRKLAQHNQREVPSELFIDDERYRWQDFMEFIRAYDVASEFIQTPDDLYTVTYEYLKSIAETGAVYAELTISPDHAEKVGISYDVQVNTIAEACQQAEVELGIASRLIVVLVRHEGFKRCEEVLDWVLKYPHASVVGIGLAGDEKGFPPKPFAPLFHRARDAGLGLTAHAGEWDGPKRVLEAVETLGVSRIGHGVRASEDVGLLKELIARGIHFEICPGSNIALGVYPNAEKHPLRLFKKMGADFSLNSDDPPFFATSLYNEYDCARRDFGFTAFDLKQVTLKALEASFAPAPLKARLIQHLSQKIELDSV